MKIPIVIVGMAEEPELFSDWLLEIRDFINNALGETYQCMNCGRDLVVFQHLDYTDKEGGKKLCMPCQGGS